MGGKRRISFGVVKHGIERRGQWLQFRKTGKNRTVPNFAVEDKGWPLRHLQQVKVGRVRPHLPFNSWRTRALE